MTFEEVITYTTYVTTGASILRIILHWLRQFPLLLFFVPDKEESNFWKFYTAIELSTTYISISLAAFGKQKASSTLDAPVAKSISPGEGQIKP